MPMGGGANILAESYTFIRCVNIYYTLLPEKDCRVGDRVAGVNFYRIM